MENWQYRDMFVEMMCQVIRDANESFGADHWNKAIRFEFRHKDGDAITLLCHAAYGNARYVGIYSVDKPVERKSGRFPDFSEDPAIESNWKFRTDHDCATGEAIKNFLVEHEEEIVRFDFIHAWKIIPVTDEMNRRMRLLRLWTREKNRG